MMPVPAEPKIYHIIHVDRLPSIVADGHLWCDTTMAQRNSPGTTIGISSIKERRLRQPLTSYPDLHVGDCVPFYFCPRSIMLYVIYRANHPDLTYTGGQDFIIHFEADFYTTIKWAEKNGAHWVFTTSNAGSHFFEDYCDPNQLSEINWTAIQAMNWQSCKDEKPAEFLLECSFPWQLIERIGVCSQSVHKQVSRALPANGHRPPVEVIKSWYY